MKTLLAQKSYEIQGRYNPATVSQFKKLLIQRIKPKDKIMNWNATKDNEFVPGISERILFESDPGSKRLRIIWKIVYGLVVIVILVFILYTALSGWLISTLADLLPMTIATILADLVLLGIIPAVLLAWQADDVASAITGKFILTDQRIWIKGSPHAWNRVDISLEDVAGMRCQRGAIFFRQISTRKLHVHMFPGAKKFTAAYETLIKSEDAKTF